MGAARVKPHSVLICFARAADGLHVALVLVADGGIEGGPVDFELVLGM